MGDPFALFDRLTAARAEQTVEEVERFEFGVDQTRVQRQQERRERLGQLRAREHTGSRPQRVFELYG